MPFVLGNAKTVDGGNAETFTFKVGKGAATAEGEGAGLTSLAAIQKARGMSLTGTTLRSVEDLDHAKRTLANRFDSRKGADQGAWFWSLAQQVDEASALQGGAFLGGAGASRAQGVEAAYRKLAAQPHGAGARGLLETSSAALTTMAAGDCPSTTVLSWKADEEKFGDVAIPSGGAVNGGEYCLAILSDLMTETDKEKIKATVQTVLTSFKDVVYGDEFAAVNGYTFKPVIVIVDFSDEDLWPASAAYQIAGAFLSEQTETTKMPMLYMPSDLSEVTINGTPVGGEEETNRAKWHGTIAHELQHAAMHYYRVEKGGVENENVTVDEGIAHFFEDVYGYGAENFDTFAKAYLQAWGLNGVPALHSEEAKALNRGGAHSLFYYLMSQQGGVEYDAGTIKGGGGLEFLAKIVKNTAATGPDNIAAAFGGDWLDTMGNFYGALVVDGAGLKGAPNEYVCADPKTGVHDLTGKTDKTFGMHFNGFKDLPALGDYSAYAVAETDATDEITFYATYPMLYAADGGAATVTLTISDTDQENVGATVVRIK
jgi:hypothetical protein